KYLFDLRDEGTLIIDTTFVKNLALAADNTYELPFTEITQERLGSPISTNVVSLAFLIKTTGIVSPEALEESLRYTVKPAFVSLNLRAMELGFELADNYGK
ncbi:MAG: 2-oxoacid:acceptor oxidoreductase family protein, partial [Candidatus Cloacimonadaceae bacterium]